MYSMYYYVLCSSGAEGILVNIFDEPEEIGVSITENRFVAPLEKMANSAVFPVEIHGIGLIHALHDF